MVKQPALNLLPASGMNIIYLCCVMLSASRFTRTAFGKRPAVNSFTKG